MDDVLDIEEETDMVSLLNWNPAAPTQPVPKSPSPTCKELNEQCRSRGVKVSGRKTDLKRRLKEHMRQRGNPTETPPKRTGLIENVKADTESMEATAHPPSQTSNTEEDPAQQECADYVYEADDESDIHLEKKAQNKEKETQAEAMDIIDSSLEPVKREITRLWEVTQLIGQKTLNYDKVIDMLANERCRNEKLKGKIEELEKKNLTLKKGNRKQNKSEVTENSYVTEPRPKATIEEEQQNELKDTFRLNYQLKEELTSLKEKSKVLQIEQEKKKD